MPLLELRLLSFESQNFLPQVILYKLHWKDFSRFENSYLGPERWGKTIMVMRTTSSSESLILKCLSLLQMTSIDLKKHQHLENLLPDEQYREGSERRSLFKILALPTDPWVSLRNPCQRGYFELSPCWSDQGNATQYQTIYSAWSQSHPSPWAWEFLKLTWSLDRELEYNSKDLWLLEVVQSPRSMKRK